MQQQPYILGPTSTRFTARKLGRLYREAQFPPVTIAVGRGKPVGVADASGVMIGLEALCANNWLDPDVENRFVHVVAHEYVHVQQAQRAPAFYDDPTPTVLGASLGEGAAEFTGELVSGAVSYGYFECPIRQCFSHTAAGTRAFASTNAKLAALHSSRSGLFQSAGATTGSLKERSIATSTCSSVAN